MIVRRKRVEEDVNTLGSFLVEQCLNVDWCQFLIEDTPLADVTFLHLHDKEAQASLLHVDFKLVAFYSVMLFFLQSFYLCALDLCLDRANEVFFFIGFSVIDEHRAVPQRSTVIVRKIGAQTIRCINKVTHFIECILLYFRR